MTKKGNAMPLKMTNEVSLMDIIAIGGLLLGGAAVFFNYGTDIAQNKLAIHGVENDIARVERKVDTENGKVIDMLRLQTIEMREIRQESEAGRIRIETKIDRMLERELNGGRK